MIFFSKLFRITLSFLNCSLTVPTPKLLLLLSTRLNFRFSLFAVGLTWQHYYCITAVYY